MRIKPVFNLVVVEVPGLEQVHESGLIIEVEAIPNKAKVVATGPDCKLGLEEGDEVFIRTYGWEEHVEGKVKYLVGSEENILGTVEK